MREARPERKHAPTDALSRGDRDRIEHCVVCTLARVPAGLTAAVRTPCIKLRPQPRVDELVHATLFGVNARRTAPSARCCMDLTAPTLRLVVEATSSSDWSRTNRRIRRSR